MEEHKGTKLKEEFWGYFYKSRNSNSNSVSKHMIENVKG
jgi:hypothetical protein